MFTCAVCHGEASRDELVEEVFKIDGRYVLVESIPAAVCVRCGEQSFSRETVERVRLLVNDDTCAAESISMQVFDLALFPS